jgi:PPOX class probable F420-dependent enzyme
MARVTERLGEGLNRLYPRLMRQDGAAVATTPPEAGLDRFRGRKYCTVVSYRRNGSPVATPVWFGIAGGRLYFRSLADAVKLRRIARDERVLVAPCTARGRQAGPPFEGRARILDDEAEVAEAEQAIQSNYGAGRRAYERAIRDAPARYVEVVPVG